MLDLRDKEAGLQTLTAVLLQHYLRILSIEKDAVPDVRFACCDGGAE
jgi:hypothetical protein